MRILINRICNKLSGAEIYNLYLLKGLKKYSDLDIIFSSDNNELNKRIRQIGFPTILVQPGVDEIGTKKHFLKTLLVLPIYLSRFQKVFSKVWKVDLIVFQSMTEKIFLTPFLKLLKQKVVWIEHGPLFATQRASIIKWLYVLVARFVDKIICVSHSTRTDLIANNIRGTKAITMYVGIDTNEFMPLDSSTIFRLKSKINWQNKSIVGFLGTVSKEKGIEDFVEVATLIAKEKKDIRFLVIGDGSSLEWAKHEVESRNLSLYFHFTGFVADVREYLGILDVLLFPSYHKEGLSISLLEANAMGIPCVASNIGGNKEIIFPNKNGLIYTNSSPSKIKDLVLSVLQDRKKYTTHARKVVLDLFSLEENSQKFYQLFTSINEK